MEGPAATWHGRRLKAPGAAPVGRQPRWSSAITTGDATNKQNLLLLVQLRWLAVGGQVLTVLVAQYGLGVPLPLSQMGAVIASLVALNVISLIRYRNQAAVTNTELFLELCLDVAALTVQLYLSGGATNPFVSLYLLQVALGAVLLEAWSTWALVLLTSGCYLWLTRAYRGLELPHNHAGGIFRLHIDGMFVCFVLAATLLVLFIARINGNIRARDAHLADMRQQSAEEDHIVRMGLLASGAAHELGTPLATLSVILSDWRRLQVFRDNPELLEEIADMQGQIDRCKTIVSGILLSSGEARGEGTVRTTVNAFLDELVDEWRIRRGPRRLTYSNGFGANEAIVSDTALKQVICNIIDNAIEASPDWVGIDVSRRGDDLVVTVSDTGPGFEPDMLETVGKPYRSTKGRPGGGLGLFLVVNVVRKLGGAVTARNLEEGGAQVTLVLPLAAISLGEVDGHASGH